MDNIITNIASVLTYSGPSVHELVKEAINNGSKYKIFENKGSTILEINSILPYNMVVQDKYSFDNDGKMIKHVVCIDSKEEVVFDKYREAIKLINKIDKYQKTA